MASTFPFVASYSYKPQQSSGNNNGLSLRPSQLQPKPTPALDLPGLQAASRVLQDQFVKDAQIIPDIGEMLTTPGGQSSASYSIFPDDYRVPFQKRRLVGIPEALFQYYNTTNVTSHMGLIPDIERVWISIDHKLFLWDYVDGQEINSFMDQPDVITHVAVVQPKPGVFIDEISSIMVICTPVSVLLIGLSTASVVGPNNRPRKDIKMYATDMTVSTEIEMTSVAGTSDGRIFMCGSQDGCLYELHYQQSESWFGKRVQLINHSVGGVQSLFPRFTSPSQEDRIISVVSDPTRSCFYTLTAKNAISVYRSSGEKAIQIVQTISNLYKTAQEKAPGSPALTPSNFSIVSLHVVGPAESRSGVQLMAITMNGVRLYLAPSAGGYSYSYTPSSSSGPGTSRPLQLIHVRLPPSNLLHPDEQSSAFRPTNSYGVARTAPPPSTSRPFVISGLENSCYLDGLTIAAQPGDVDGTDFLLCMAPDLTRIGTIGQLNLAQQQIVPQQPVYGGASYNPSGNQRPPLTEYATLLAIPGRTWAMASVPRSVAAASSSTSSPVVTNELASQFSETPRQFMILTNVGVTYLVKRRALDYLKAVVEEVHAEGTVQPIIEFRDSFGRDQTCAMLLGLASGNTFLDIGEQSSIGTLSTVSPDIANVAKQAFYDFGERPIWAERMTYGTSDSSGSAIFSGRREGLAIYFARLVRPYWKEKMTKPGPLGLQQSNIEESLLVIVQKNLQAVKTFLEKNPHLFHSTPGDPSVTRTTAGNEQEAWKAEQNSVGQLQTLLNRTIEAISFILLLNDYRLGELIAQCDSDTQKLVTSMTFEDLVTTQNGVTISRALVNIVIDQQIGQQISVDTISEVLQQRCGSFCSTDDVMLYKARENVRKAVESKNPAERQNWLGESLRLFMKGARILEFDKIREICGEYQQLGYAKGAIELPLSCAQALDPDNIGLEYWYSGSPPNDARSEFSRIRIRCYELVLDSLNVFEEKTSKGAQPQGHGAVEAPETVRSHAYDLAFASEDEMFHSTMYDWLIERGLADELLAMRPAFLEAHLKREPATVPKFQLLWQFYVKDGQPLRAAEVLALLAESSEIDLSLGARLEYLTLAVGNAKSHPVTVGGRHETAIAFLTDLEEKLDVAQVQLEIYHALLPHINDQGETGDKIKLLDKRLMNMSELYQLYAEAYDLPVMKLLILHVSEHRDPHVVEPIWDRLYEDALEKDADAQTNADHLIASFVPLGKRFYPSESAFPLRHVARKLVMFALAHRAHLPSGWVPRVLVQCGVPYTEVWDLLHAMYDSQTPPFEAQVRVQTMSEDIAVLLSDWLEEAKRPQSSVARGEVPVGRIDLAVDQYLAELEPSRTETKGIYEGIKRQLRRNW
ncbi:nucleoporin [Hygrophoropsis aurantiaca]|uniref:Nucleoporin n=1 Tax=Hygrophoropsis aurantiaca TaxID=72124 RepID=A0ACB8AI58_9AGAM|nr:nucleoporin [Hygrophoropsis aurantiaca]